MFAFFRTSTIVNRLISISSGPTTEFVSTIEQQVRKIGHTRPGELRKMASDESFCKGSCVVEGKLEKETIAVGKTAGSEKTR